MGLKRQSTVPRWMAVVLYAAAMYNIAWGAWTILFPNAIFTWAGMQPPNYPELWQCVGMIVGVYGVAYGLAARDPLRHWPVVFAGLLGKVLGPIGLANAILQDRLPVRFGATCLFNDFIWWIPFALILRAAWRARVK